MAKHFGKTVDVLRCSACNGQFPAVQVEGRIKECTCGAGYEYRSGRWLWVYNKRPEKAKP